MLSVISVFGSFIVRVEQVSRQVSVAHAQNSSDRCAAGQRHKQSFQSAEKASKKAGNEFHQDFCSACDGGLLPPAGLLLSNYIFRDTGKKQHIVS